MPNNSNAKDGTARSADVHPCAYPVFTPVSTPPHIYTPSPGPSIVQSRTPSHQSVHLCNGRPCTAVSSAASIADWWRELDTVVRLSRLVGEPCFLLVDAKTRVGTVTSALFGDLFSEQESSSGAEFHHVSRHVLAGDLCSARP